MDIEVKSGEKDKSMMVENVWKIFKIVEGKVKEIVGDLIIGEIYEDGRVEEREGKMKLDEKEDLKNVGEKEIGEGERWRKVEVRREFRRRIEKEGKNGWIGKRDVI